MDAALSNGGAARATCSPGKLSTGTSQALEEMRSDDFLGDDGLLQGFLLEVEKNHHIFPTEICSLHPELRKKERKTESLNYSP